MPQISVELVALLIAVAGAIFWAGRMDAKIDAILAMISSRFDSLEKRIARLESESDGPN